MLHANAFSIAQVRVGVKLGDYIQGVRTEHMKCVGMQIGERFASSAGPPSIRQRRIEGRGASLCGATSAMQHGTSLAGCNARATSHALDAWLPCNRVYRHDTCNVVQ